MNSKRDLFRVSMAKLFIRTVKGSKKEKNILSKKEEKVNLISFKSEVVKRAPELQ